MANYIFRNDYLLKLIEKTDVSRNDLAEAIGISRASMQLYCQGKESPSIDALLKMSDFFCIPIDVLIGRCTEEEFNDIYTNYSSCFMILRSRAYSDYLLKRKAGANNAFSFPDLKNCKLEAGWPNNLIDSVCCKTVPIYATHDIYAGVEKAIESLNNEREQQCIYWYFRAGMTLKEISTVYGLTVERIRQIMSKALRKLRHPARYQFIRYGANGGSLNDDVLYLEQKKASLEAQIKLLNTELQDSQEDLTKKILDRNSLDYKSRFGILPEMDLSVRTFNCLARANCTTLPEIIKLVSSGEVINLRNFGKRSLNEVLTVLKEKYDTDLFYVYNLVG